jgi:hypothetical protein
MKPTFIVLAIWCAMQHAHAQTQNVFGAHLNLNNCTQLMRYPQRPEEGTFQANSLNTIGLGAFWQRALGNSGRHFGLIRAQYLRKGFRLPAQYGEVFSQVYFEFDQVHRFDFVDVDMLYRHKFHNRFVPQITAGIKGGVMFSKKLGSDFYPLNASSYPAEFYDYNKVTVGWLLGLGYTITPELGIHLETSREFLPTISRDNFKAINWVTSLNLSFNISRMFQKATS